MFIVQTLFLHATLSAEASDLLYYSMKLIAVGASINLVVLQFSVSCQTISDL